MRYDGLVLVAALSLSGAVFADCYEQVQVGDPSFIVIEKCGEPERREEEVRRSASIEVVRGSEVSSQRPQQPMVIENWYYNTSLNAATVIRFQDGGVTQKEQLVRE
jgi:hypothetical protein